MSLLPGVVDRPALRVDDEPARPKALSSPDAQARFQVPLGSFRISDRPRSHPTARGGRRPPGEAELDLSGIVGARFEPAVAPVDRATPERAHPSSLLVEEDMGGDARDVLSLRIKIERTSAEVAGIERIFVHDAAPARVEENPCEPRGLALTSRRFS